MKDSLTVGATTTARIGIDAARTIDFMGDDVRVYSTPNLLYDIEMTCRQLLSEFQDPGEDSVGTRVELDHTGATLAGMWVDISVTVTAVQGRAVAFDFLVTDALESVAKGKHSRFVVDIAKTAERLKGKAARCRAA